MLPALFALAVTGCGGDDPSPADTQWAQELKTEMTQYLGLVLPYVQFNQDTLYHRWDTTDNAYIIGDYQETSVLDDYGTRLTRTGWTATTTTEGLAYVKTTEVGELTLFADFYEADDEYPAGNEIAVYVDEEGGGGGEIVTGKIEFFMYEMGWEHEETNPTVVADPGLLIEADQGDNPNETGKPKYWDTDLTLRLYAQNTLTLSADNITEIEFKFESVKKNQTMTPDMGEITAFSTAGALWVAGDEEVSTVTFTIGDISGGKIFIKSIIVTGTFSGGGVVPPGPSDERTIADVAEDICDMLDFDHNEINYIEGDAYIAVEFEGVTSLKEACEAGLDYLPDYLDEYEAPAAGQWDEDGDDGYFATYVEEDSLIYVEIGSYLAGSDYVTQYCVYQMVY